MANNKSNKLLRNENKIPQIKSQFINYKKMNLIHNNLKNKNNKIVFNRTNELSQIKFITTNNYLVNSLTLSNKESLFNSYSQLKNDENLETQQNLLSKQNQAYIIENEELKKIKLNEDKKIEKIIQKTQETEQKYELLLKKYLHLKNENSQLKESQDQFILLIKIIQGNGVDVEGIMDKWNNEIENNNIKDDESLNFSTLNKEDENFESLSFISLTYPNEENNEKNKIKPIEVPKLNLEQTTFSAKPQKKPVNKILDIKRANIPNNNYKNKIKGIPLKPK